jgi:hypothetical protein
MNKELLIKKYNLGPEFEKELDEVLANEFKEGYDKGWHDRGWTIRKNVLTEK